VSSELKRFLVLGLVALAASVVLLLPISRVQSRIRPRNVPSTALFASAKGRVNWIDCQQGPSTNLQFCTVYTRDGRSVLVRGTFTRSLIRTMSTNLYYDGTAIHWRNGVVLEPQHLDCAAGDAGPTGVPDCKSSSLP
jgi:hypothetical protein